MLTKIKYLCSICGTEIKKDSGVILRGELTTLPDEKKACEVIFKTEEQIEGDALCGNCIRAHIDKNFFR